MDKKFLPNKLENSRICLKRHSLDNAYAMFAEVDKDRERLRQFLPWVDHMKSVENEIWYINECQKDWEAGTMFDYGIFSRTGDYIGNIGVHNIVWKNDCCELGYWIVKNHEGQGSISAAVQLLEDVLFESGFNRIEIRCDPSNKKSAAVPIRNGYVFDGILRKNMIHQGVYRDTAVYGKLREEFRSELNSRK